VFEVPEVGTIAFNAGVNLTPSAYAREEHKVFTHAICKAQIDLESYFESLSTLQKRPVLIITDRGVSDNFAYTVAENKHKIMEENKWTQDYIRDDRYDLVIFLVTAASGALEFYTKANNVARSESPEEAMALDDRNAFEYIGHPNLRVIDNTHYGFGEKLSRVLNTIGAFVDRLPETFYVKSYLLPETFEFKKTHYTMEHHHFKEKLTRLVPRDGRKAVWWVSKKFNHFNKPPIHEIVIQRVNDEDPSTFVESHQFITKENYDRDLASADPQFRQVERIGISYLFNMEHEHNVISLGKVTLKGGSTRYLLRLIRDTKFTVETKLPDYAAGQEQIKQDLFAFLKEKGYC
jgi:hypothetical protein